jgi:YegS/Rv2252/BmrU family lipid kinase
MRHIFIINPKSFRKVSEMETVIAGIRDFFEGREDCFIYVSQFPRDAIGVIRERAKDIPPEEKFRVYAVGGDGILFDCLNGIVGLPNAELASVPCGRSNDFIRAFGEGRKDLFKDIALQAAAPAIPTDLIYYGNNYALNVCTIGMESVAVIKMAEINKKYRRILAWFPGLYDFMFFLGGLIGLFDQRLIFQHYQITIDGKDYSGNYSAINISNGPCYGGDMCAVPTAVPDDGLLDICMVKSMSTFKLLNIMSGYLKGRIKSKYRTLVRAQKIDIRSELPLLIEMDGEVLFDTNITVEIASGAIRFAAVKGLKYEKRAEFNG